MNAKKMFGLALAAVLTVGALSGCGAKEETPAAPAEETPADSADEAPADEAGEADGGEMTAAIQIGRAHV